MSGLSGVSQVVKLSLALLRRIVGAFKYFVFLSMGLKVSEIISIYSSSKCCSRVSPMVWCHVPQSHPNPIYNRVQIIFTECMIIILCHGPRHRRNYVSRAINLIQHTPNVTRLPSPIWRVHRETDPAGHTLTWNFFHNLRIKAIRKIFLILK